MIEIGYAGSLAHFDPNKRVKQSIFKKLFWTYRNKFELSLTRSPYFLFKALEQLKGEDTNLSSKIKLSLWGMIDDGNKQQVKELGIDDLVEITGNKPRPESLQKLNGCDLLYLPLEQGSEEHNTLFIPGKVFEYLQLRKPILVLDKDSDCSDIVRKSGLGIFSKPDDIEEIAKVLRDLINDPEKIKGNLKPDENYIESLKFENRAKEIGLIFDRLLNKN